MNFFNFKIIAVFLLFTVYGFSQTPHPSDINQTIRIPVVFHLVGKNPKTVITKQTLKTIVNYANKGFNNVDKYKIIKEYRDIVATCNIELFIPKTAIDKSNIEKPAISYHYDGKTFKSHADESNSEYQLPYDRELKKYGYVNSKKYLNIWITNLKGGSYSTMPQEKNELNDGIVLNIGEFYRIDTVISNNNLKYVGMVLNHEIGHWLGLWHIWGNHDKNTKICNCSPFTNECSDYIDDTPRQGKANKLNFDGKLIDKMIKTCLNPFKVSNYQNFMDYSYNVGMFTKGQKTKMRYNIFKYRSEFLENTYNVNAKKIVIDNKYNNKLEYRITGFNRNRYYDVSSDNFKVVQPGRYLIEINDSKTKRGIASNIFNIYNPNKGIIIFIDKYGCTKWKYIGNSTLYEFSFNINKLEGKCSDTSAFSPNQRTHNRNTRKRYNVKNNNTKKRSGNNSFYNSGYDRIQKMKNDGYKRAQKMYEDAKKKRSNYQSNKGRRSFYGSYKRATKNYNPTKP